MVDFLTNSPESKQTILAHKITRDLSQSPKSSKFKDKENIFWFEQDWLQRKNVVKEIIEQIVR